MITIADLNKLAADFTATNEQSVGNLAAMAAFHDLCKTWKAMDEVKMPVDVERMILDINSTVEVLEQLRAFLSKQNKPALKILSGKPAKGLGRT